MKEELLIEVWGLPGDIPSDYIVESIDDGKGALYIEGIFMQANVKNRNGRIYPKSVLAKAVEDYTNSQILTKQSLGETNHPSRPIPDPNLASIIVEKLWWEGDNVMGRARVIEGDFGPGDKLAANIRAGWIPGVSSRGLGQVKNGFVQEGYRLTVAVDVVWGPSAPQAYVKPLRESADDEPEAPADAINIHVTTLNEAFSQMAKNMASMLN
ncbi:prohead core protein protease [Aeromonas phage B614]|nr:prohead core protein protease [Aeromonas phage B614]UYD58262.1 prohead core protein protease [Aeromonas phage UP87]UYD58376.1 prohead core protein protease [Aeromonas phage avDM14-QBC]UYD58840.1 prohead core protein protease [Aeromonas phage avDM10-HWA]UYD59105.1 prohead core protein protease [Aeromonas phage avDM7-IJDJ]UYD59917.1 prohead core protein protease [Aeromonas phage avDM9-HANS]